MIEIPELRRLLAEATPGDWKIGPSQFDLETDRVHIGYMFMGVDAALITAAINALPALLDEIERLRARMPD